MRPRDQHDEPLVGGDPLEREFGFSYGDGTGTYTRIGPDGVETQVTLDAVGRVQFERRGPQPAPLMTATYTYYPDGQVDTITYGNGASVYYEYDAARRVVGIGHLDGGGQVMLSLEYAYTDHDLPSLIAESDAGVIALVDFDYDDRDRLITDHRAATDPLTRYNLTYTYDLGGNRLTKEDALNETLIVYHYDLEDPVLYGGANNRLMYYEMFDLSGGGDPVLLSTTWYYYNDVGNATRVVSEDASDPGVFTANRLEYASNGQAVTYIVGEQWTGVEEASCPADYTVTSATEFRYDAARERYRVRQLEPAGLTDIPQAFIALSDVWSDYHEDWVYGDFDPSGGSITQLASYESGMWQSQSGVDEYLHSDLIGTLRGQSDGAGFVTDRPIYTAFGEVVNGSNNRFGYVGAWGYQSTDVLPLLHVGARYYDPSTGRFLQRDPIGISAGTNVYSYVGNTPTRWVDPLGLNPVECQDQCDTWWKASGRGRKDLEDAYMSCLDDYWPPTPARQPPPKPFRPWPGPNPPVKAPRAPISGPSPTGGGGWEGKAPLVLVVLMLFTLAVSLRKQSAMGRAGTA